MRMIEKISLYDIYKKYNAMATSIGRYELQFLSFAQARKKATVQAGELVAELKWTTEQERSILSRLARKSIIVRVRRGLYLVPSTLPPGGKWSPSEFLALSVLIGDRQGRYQLSGPTTFYRYGWTEQVPNRMYAYNNRISGSRQIGPVALTLIKIADERLGSTEVVRTPDGIDVVYASKARSLLDAVYDWSRFDSLPRAFDWIREEVKKDDAFTAEFVQVLLKYGNQGTLRRVGTLLEMLNIQKPLLRRLEKSVGKSSSFIPWVPNRPKRGVINKRWGVVINYE
jgi:predicted transcriptional regulator of viral defense system